MVRADSGKKAGQDIFKRFAINATPTVMTLDGDGGIVDWTVGYGPPPEKFHAQMERMVAGTETFKSLTADLARNPNDAAAAFKLAVKWDDRYDDAKSIEAWKKVLALDPDGKSGSYTHPYYRTTSTYTERAEFRLASIGSDPAPMKAFIKKYPGSEYLKQAYQRLSGYYASAPSKSDAAAFYAEYTAKWPDDPDVLIAWISRITRDKENFEKGAELADKIRFLTRSNPIVRINQALAGFYLAKGDAAEADLVYGKDYMTGRTSTLAYDLVGYANFWAQRGANMDAAIAAAETAVKLYPDGTYYVQQLAGVYLKAGKEDKAFAAFGPEFVKKNSGSADNLESYAAFWGGQGKNLDSALEAGKMAAGLAPDDYYAWYALSTVQFARKEYAEALKSAEKTVELADSEQTKAYYRKQIDKIKAAQAAEKK